MECVQERKIFICLLMTQLEQRLPNHNVNTEFDLAKLQNSYREVGGRTIVLGKVQ